MRGIGGIILAAGGSARMGVPKQLMTLQDQPLVRAAAWAALDGGCDSVCVVTGHERAKVESTLQGLPVTLAHHAGWRSGMGGSIRAGLEGLPPVSAVLIMTCDQPAVTAEVVARLIECFHLSGRPIAASHYCGTHGIPAIFGQACHEELRELAEDRGAKALIQRDAARVASFEFPEGGMDLDTPADVRAWREQAISMAHVPASAQRGSHRGYC